MPTHQPLHQVNARSATAWLPPEKPKVANVNFLLENGEFLSVEIPRHVLKRLVASAERAIREAAPPLRGLSKASRPAPSRSK
jgi:hypothetical protein